MVPNSAITDAPVKNLSYLSSDGRVDVEVTVDHGSDPLAVTEVLLEAAMAEPSVLADPPPKVLLHGLQGLAFELWAWTSAIHASLSLRSSLNYAIEQGLRERGIELAGAHQHIQLLSSRQRAAGDGAAPTGGPCGRPCPTIPASASLLQQHVVRWMPSTRRNG